MGLDPGIDHMLVMKAVDSIHAKGGKVRELISLCGGLPDPAAADNPLRYKFSWSPRGVLVAACAGAIHVEKGETLTVAPGSLLQSAEASKRFPTMRLEALPNRDSVKYKEIYGVPDVTTLCRGTLRYEGWSNVMHALQCLQLLDQQPIDNATASQSWAKFMQYRLNANTTNSDELKQSLTAFLTENQVKDVTAAVDAVVWLGLLEDTPLSSPAAMDSLCTVLQERLAFQDGEKDMVPMYHSVLGELPDGSMERHTSRLLAFGTPGGDSAMAATVGYTTAAAVELILRGDVSRTGVMTPVTEDLYTPILKRLRELGVTYTESIEEYKYSLYTLNN